MTLCEWPCVREDYWRVFDKKIKHHGILTKHFFVFSHTHTWSFIHFTCKGKTNVKSSSGSLSPHKDQWFLDDWLTYLRTIYPLKQTPFTYYYTLSKDRIKLMGNPYYPWLPHQTTSSTQPQRRRMERLHGESDHEGWLCRWYYGCQHIYVP